MTKERKENVFLVSALMFVLKPKYNAKANENCTEPKPKQKSQKRESQKAREESTTSDG